MLDTFQGVASSKIILFDPAAKLRTSLATNYSMFGAEYPMSRPEVTNHYFSIIKYLQLLIFEYDNKVSVDKSVGS